MRHRSRQLSWLLYHPIPAGARIRQRLTEQAAEKPDVCSLTRDRRQYFPFVVSPAIHQPFGFSQVLLWGLSRAPVSAAWSPVPTTW
jgi:CBS-domain-containing membrane protein